MGLTVIQQPDVIALSGNPILWKVRAADDDDKPYGPVGFRASITFDGTKLPEDTVITFTRTMPSGPGGSILFTAKPSPTLSTEIPDDTSVLSTLDYWTEVARIIGENVWISGEWIYALSEDSGNYTITLTTRATAEGYEGEFTCPAATSTAEEVPVADNTPVNFAVMAELRFERTWKQGGFTREAELESVPDVDGIVHFDIGGILDNLIRIEQPMLIPDWMPVAPFRPNNVSRYHLVILERSGSPPTTSILSGYDGNLVMRGGVSQPVAAIGSIFDSFNADNSLLTWMPNKGTLHFTEPALLTWYNYTAATSVVALQVKRYDFDNALVATDYVYLSAPSTVEAYNCLTFPINPEQLGATSATSKIIVRVISATGFDPEEDPAPTPTYLSQARTYYLDHSHYEDPHWLLYPNAFGAPEVIAAHGFMEEQDEVTRFVGEVLNNPAGADLREQKQYGYDWTPTYIYRSRHISLAERYALRHAWLQGELYEIFPDGYIPLMVVSDEAPVTETRQELHAMEWECRPRFRMRHYSNLAIAINNMPECGDHAWLKVSSGCWRLVFGQPWELE